MNSSPASRVKEIVQRKYFRGAYSRLNKVNLAPYYVPQREEKKLTVWKCRKCGHFCKSSHHLQSHTAQCQPTPYVKTDRVFPCNYCPKVFKQRKLGEYHLAACHRCKYCDYVGDQKDQHELNCVRKLDYYQKLLTQHGGRVRTRRQLSSTSSSSATAASGNINRFKEKKAFRGYLRTYTQKNNCKEHKDIVKYMM